MSDGVKGAWPIRPDMSVALNNVIKLFHQISDIPLCMTYGKFSTFFAQIAGIGWSILSMISLEATNKESH